MSVRGEASGEGRAASGSGISGFLCDVRTEGLRLVHTRQPVVVTDDGSGIAEALAPLLVSAAESDQIAAPGHRSTRTLPARTLALAVAGGEPEVVEVVEPGRPVDLGRARPRRVRLADHLLARFTHEHLEPVAGAPWLHGGAVVDPAGRAALVLGSSGAGKSTMIAHLVYAGLDLVNDEMVRVLPAHGCLAGFTRPVAIKPGGLGHLPSTVRSQVTEGEFGALVTAAQLGGHHRLTGRPGLVVVADRGPGHGPASWEPSSPAMALEALCANNLDLAARPVAALEALAWLAAHAVTGTLRYSDSADAAATVRQLLADEPPRADPVPWSVAVEGADHLGGRAGTGAVAGPIPATAGPVPAGAVVSVHIGGELVAYHRSSRAVIRLNGAGAELWRALPGRPATAGTGADTEAVLAELARHGFVE